jgi:translation initiation factor IF-3
VGPNGEQVGIVSIHDALKLAQEADLDLVEVAATARPPVCKLMDYGKFKYESAMKAREARKNQAHTIIKEIKLRPKIDPHDYATKKGHVVRFLRQRDKVKVTIMFRGREMSHPERGRALLERLAEDVSELGVIESAPIQDGRNMVMLLAPVRELPPTKPGANEAPNEAPSANDAPSEAPSETPAEPVEAAVAEPAAAEPAGAETAQPEVAEPKAAPKPKAAAKPKAAPKAKAAKPAAEPAVAAPEPEPEPTST